MKKDLCALCALWVFLGLLPCSAQTSSKKRSKPAPEIRASSGTHTEAKSPTSKTEQRKEILKYLEEYLMDVDEILVDYDVEKHVLTTKNQFITKKYKLSTIKVSQPQLIVEEITVKDSKNYEFGFRKKLIPALVFYGSNYITSENSVEKIHKNIKFVFSNILLLELDWPGTDGIRSMLKGSKEERDFVDKKFEEARKFNESKIEISKQLTTYLSDAQKIRINRFKKAMIALIELDRNAEKSPFE